MSHVLLSFDARDNKGNNLGDYEMFVDLTSTVQNPSTIELAAPQGYSIQGLKLYQATETGSGGTVTPNPAKANDIARLRSGTWTAVFDGQLPAGFSYDTSTNTLTDNGQTAGVFEYLIWIQSSSGSNDFVDPGIRNH